MIKYIKRFLVWLRLMDDKRPLLEQIVHNGVVLESAKSYEKYRNQGIEITTNLGAAKNRWVGGVNNQLYPDIIAWRPNYVGATGGTAIVIEQVETPSTVYNNTVFWKKLGETGIPFILIIPHGFETSVSQIIKQNGITIRELQTYSPFQNTYKFQKHNLT